MRDETATGVYIAYTRSEQFRVAHEGPDTLVNRNYTRVGIATESFVASGSEYRRRFGDRVKFIPVAEVSPDKLAQVEILVLSAVARSHAPVGASANWFQTQDRASIIALIYRLLTPAANEPEGPGERIEEAS